MWSTDRGQHSLKDLNKKMGQFLMSYAEKKQIDCKMVVVMANHVHCLVRLKSTQSMSDVIQLLKGRSSVWMNENNFVPYKFKWEDEYFAFSLGYSQLKDIEKYFSNQEKYHQQNSLKQEVQVLSDRYKLNYRS